MMINLTVDRREPEGNDVGASVGEADAVRPFQVADIMVLIAAVSVALAWDRGALFDPFLRLPSLPWAPVPLAWRLASDLGMVLERSIPYLTLGSVTVLVLWSATGRARRPRVVRMPGLVACTLASVAIVPAALADLASQRLSGKPWPVAWAGAVRDMDPGNLIGLSALIGMAVLVSWIVMVATHRWRTEAQWLDRLGRLVGLGWIAMILAGVLQAVISVNRLL